MNRLKRSILKTTTRHMQNRITLILCFVFVQVLVAQNQPKRVTKRYLKIEHYKTFYNVKSVNLDSVEYKIYKGDTLIRHEPKPDPNKVLVPFDYRDSTFLEYYIPIAFRLSERTKDPMNQSMKYWRNDIKVFFSKSISKKLRKDFKSFAKFIDQNVDSLNIVVVKSLEESNFIIYTSSDYNYEPQLVNDDKDSGYYIYWNQKNQINKGVIKLNDEDLFNDQLKAYELKKRFLQTLGHFRLDERLDCRHYFSNCYSPKKEFTQLDLELLQYHYSYGICKGISLESFQNFHQQAQKIKSQGEQIFVTHLKSELKKDD